jgi:hypothetical protein
VLSTVDSVYIGTLHNGGGSTSGRDDAEGVLEWELAALKACNETKLANGRLSSCVGCHVQGSFAGFYHDVVSKGGRYACNFGVSACACWCQPILPS